MGPRRHRVTLIEMLPTLAALAETRARFGAALVSGHELVSGIESWTAAIDLEDVRKEIGAAKAALRSMNALLTTLESVRPSLCARRVIRKFKASTQEMQRDLAVLDGRARQLEQLVGESA